MLKILAIGNSFSQDATQYLKSIADSAGINVEVANLHIGGCSLKRHAENIIGNLQVYNYERNGCFEGRVVSIQEALLEKAWDIITIQQASGLSGLIESYEPYASVVLDCIKLYAPQAKIYFHMTWSYESDSDHSQFSFYDCSQERMDHQIQETVEIFTKRTSLPVIPSGEIIRRLRKLPEFDYANGGLSLCRDGFHMSMDYGRYAVAATWFEILTRTSIEVTTFTPEGTNPVYIARIRKIVHQLCQI